MLVPPQISDKDQKNLSLHVPNLRDHSAKPRSTKFLFNCVFIFAVIAMMR